jgi:chromosomal replication initiator protein
MAGRNDLVARLDAHLRTVLPTELAEVVLPALRWRSGPGRLTAIPCSAAWTEVLIDHVALPARAWLTAQGIELRLPAPAGDDDEAVPPQDGFATFLADPGNQLALTAARRTVAAPGLEHNPYYLHGPAGCGKTHLVNAIAGEYRATLGDEAALVVSGETFVTTWASQLNERRTDGLRARIAQSAVLVIDGLDALAGRTLAQEELFHLINDSLDEGRQLVFAARLPPRQLSGLEERLATRLAWGLVAGLERPLVETRLALLRRLAGSAADDEPDLATLVEEQAPDMHLVAALARRLAAGERPAAAPGTVGFDRIVSAVAARCGLRPGDLAGKQRHLGVNRARGLALLLGRRLTSHSLEALGGMVGGRSHATVLHAVRVTEERLRADPALRRLADEVSQEVLADEAG